MFTIEDFYPVICRNPEKPGFFLLLPGFFFFTHKILWVKRNP